MIYPQPKWAALSFYWFTIASLYPQDSMASGDLYNELISLNAACGYRDSCLPLRPTEDLRVVNCQCGPICAHLGTCCMDSIYRKGKLNNRIKATKIFRNPLIVFMVNDCKPDWKGDKGIKDLCEVDTQIAYTQDPFLLIPVTNLRSGITYRNYYCFACNEDRSSDTPVLWEFLLFSWTNLSVGAIEEVRYDNNTDDYAANGYGFYATVGVPKKLSLYLNYYRRNVISTCDEKWTDIATKKKCESYTAMVYYFRPNNSPIYKNLHCAICNYKNVSNLRCTEPEKNEVWGGPPYGFLLTGIFSLEDKVSRCPRNEVFDNFSKKCRAFRCGSNQKLADGRCV